MGVKLLSYLTRGECEIRWERIIKGKIAHPTGSMLTE